MHPNPPDPVTLPPCLLFLYFLVFLPPPKKAEIPAIFPRPEAITKAVVPATPSTPAIFVGVNACPFSPASFEDCSDVGTAANNGAVSESVEFVIVDLSNFSILFINSYSFPFGSNLSGKIVHLNCTFILNVFSKIFATLLVIIIANVMSEFPFI